MIYFLLFFTGLILGSLANMLSYRLPLNQPLVFDRSRCSSCKTILPAMSLIPVLSFLIQKGRCHSCKRLIPIRYLLLELSMAALFCITYFIQGHGTLTWIHLGFIFFSLILFVTDLETFNLPYVPLIGIGLLGIGRIILDSNIQSHLLGLLIGSIIFLLIRFISGLAYKQEAMGLGDVFLTGVIGLYLGLHATLFYIYFSFLIGGILGVCLLLFSQKDKKDSIPFGPILIVSALLALFWGDLLWSHLHF